MTDSMRRVFLQGLRYLLRPIAQYCVRHAIKLQDFVDFAKVAMLEAAERDMTRSGVALSASKLAVMTGLHRRDVARLHGTGHDVRDDATLLSRLIGQWRGDKRFQTRARRPRTLSIEGKESEFVQLVRTVSQDLNPYTVLFELERSASVERIAGGIRLRSTAFVPTGDVRQAFSILSSDIADLVSAVDENVFSSPEIPNLHIHTEYDNVSENAVQELRIWLLEEGTKFHQRAQKFLAARDQDVTPNQRSAGGGVRVALGSFSRVEAPLK